MGYPFAREGARLREGRSAEASLAAQGVPAIGAIAVRALWLVRSSHTRAFSSSAGRG